ncbi:MAG: adenosylcobinamide-phosphate synthase CbiB [Gaiellaceae bacterium]
MVGAGLLLDGAFGDPQPFHPVAGFGRVAGALERRMWSDSRGRGIAYVALLVGGTGSLCVRRGVVFRLVVLWACLGGRSLRAAANAMGDALAAGDLERARRLAPTLVGRDPSRLEAPELARATIESVAENTGDAVIAPLFWFAVGGAPAAAAYRAANTLDAMVGHRSERYSRFGWAAARLDDLLNYVPARAGAATVVLAAALTGDDAVGAARAVLRDGAKHPSPNAGLYEASFAGALGLSLGGANTYGGVLEQRPILGDGRLPEVRDIARANRLAATTAVVFAIALMARR